MGKIQNVVTSSLNALRPPAEYNFLREENTK